MKWAWSLVALAALSCNTPQVRRTNRGVLWLTVVGSDEALAENPTWDFGELALGTRKEVTVRAVNMGPESLRVTGVFLGVVGNGSFYVRDVSGELEPEESLTATVTFSPATVGAQQSQVTFAHDADTPQPSLRLLGSGR